MSSPAETALEVASKLAAIILELVPAPVAQQLISDAAVRRANALGDLADDVKFGPEK